MMNLFSTKIYYYVQKTLQKYLLQYIAICNRISANLLHIAICNKWYLIALHIYCNSPVIYCQWSGLHIFPPFFFYFFGAINMSILFSQDFFSLFQSTMQLLMLSDHVATKYQWRVLYELRRVSADPTYTRSNMNVKVIYATRWSLKPRGKKT